MVKQFFKRVIQKLFWSDLQRFLSDNQYIQILYWLLHDIFPNLENPQRFTEKIHYIKLHDRNELRRTFANRIKVRKYVAQKAGDEFLIPLIGIYESLTPSVWDSMPRQFVLKANHGSAMINIVRNKANENYPEIHDQTERWKKRDFYRERREWAYKGLPRTIVAEKLILNANGSIPKDYKFFCFNGRVKLIQIDYDRFNNPKRNLYDRNFNQLDARLLHPNYSGPSRRPKNLKKAVALAEHLAGEINFVRVDLYLPCRRIYFGELTNYPGNGFSPFEPESMEYKIGSYLNLGK